MKQESGMSRSKDMPLSLCYFVTFRTRYVRWILLIHLTPPYGLILPSCAWTAIQAWQNDICLRLLRRCLRLPYYKLGNRRFPGLWPPLRVACPPFHLRYRISLAYSSIHLSIQVRKAFKPSSLLAGSSIIF